MLVWIVPVKQGYSRIHGMRQEFLATARRHCDRRSDQKVRSSSSLGQQGALRRRPPGHTGGGLESPDLPSGKAVRQSWPEAPSAASLDGFLHRLTPSWTLHFCTVWKKNAGCVWWGWTC